MSTIRHAVQNRVVEWGYESGKAYADPFNEATLDVIFTNDIGTWRMPAYWAGGQEWRVRFAPPQPGTYRFRTECSDDSNPDLHDRTGVLEATPYDGADSLSVHGPIRVAGDRRHFQHADGTPFFWLGDTWWMGFTKRLGWPDDFQRLAADRVAKRFSVIQIVAGLYPDMPPLDERGANEAGVAWETDFARINPAFFDMADLRIQWLLRCGLVPCIVGCWGYYLPILGVEKMLRHWRHLIARWAAYPVFWCLAGEGVMPYYLSETREADAEQQKAGWTEIARAVARVDPFRRPITIHPDTNGREQVLDDSVLDFNMLQAGHSPDCVGTALRLIRENHTQEPKMPVLVGEYAYEGILHGCNDEVQRLAFWSAMLSGAAGHTYGANGIWQMNTRHEPFGPSPHGGSWGDTPWEDAYRLPGSQQLGLARRVLERYDWWRFEPHLEWISPTATEQDPRGPYAAGIPRKVRVFYVYWPSFPWDSKRLQVQNIEPDTPYAAIYIDPRTGREHPLGRIHPDASGTWPVPTPPTMSDWLLVLECR